MGDFTYEVIQTYGVLSTSQKGWTLELNLISWNRKDPKLDLRTWSPDHQKMTKGVTLTEEEAAELKQILERVPAGFK